MIRTIIRAKKNQLTIQLPNKYVGKQVEVIAFSLEDESEKSDKKRKHVTFDAVSIDTKGFKFNRNEANAR